MSDLIDRQAAISYAISGRIRTLPTSEDGENWIRTSEVRQSLLTMPSVRLEIVRCKECKYAPKCYGDVLMRSRSGGHIYCPVEYCSAAKRRTDE